MHTEMPLKYFREHELQRRGQILDFPEKKELCVMTMSHREHQLYGNLPTTNI